MGSTDYLEQYFAINLVFEPLVGELFRSGFLMQVAAANSDFITPPVISAAEADYERNLANTIDLVYLLANDETARRAQPEAVPGLGRQARRRSPTRPPRACSRSGRSRIPSRSRSRTSRAQSEERLGKILGELGLKR